MRFTRIALILALTSVTVLPGCALFAGGAALTGAMMADDRRTTATYLQDEEIELRAGSMYREKRIEGVHANFTSYNRRLLITGEAPTEAVKAQVTESVTNVPSVREIVNEIQIMPPTSITSRTSDGYVTAKVKARFLDEKGFSANHIKVVTENGITYLMGMVKHDEGKLAAEVAAKTSGVRKVVKVFEYLD